MRYLVAGNVWHCRPDNVPRTQCGLRVLGRVVECWVSSVTIEQAKELSAQMEPGLASLPSCKICFPDLDI